MPVEHEIKFGAPTGREEAWRFTPVRQLKSIFALAQDPSIQGPQLRYSTDVLQLPPGITVKAMPADMRPGTAPDDVVTSAVHAHANTCTVLNIGAEIYADVPITIVVTDQQERTSVEPTAPSVGRLLINAEAFSDTTVVIRHEGFTESASLIDIVVGDNAKLTVVNIHLWDTGQDSKLQVKHLQHEHITVGRDAKVTDIAVTLNQGLVRKTVTADYTAPGGDVECYGLYFPQAAQHHEHRLLVDHSVPNCRSYVEYKGALTGNDAHSVWVGDVVIQAGATGTDTYEINRNLLMSDGARADSVPNLEIETGEVVGAGHASATGRFDDQQLFYLQSRGITAEEAQKLVVRGFFAQILQHIPDTTLVQELTSYIEKALTLNEVSAIEAQSQREVEYA